MHLTRLTRVMLHLTRSTRGMLHLTRSTHGSCIWCVSYASQVSCSGSDYRWGIAESTHRSPTKDMKRIGQIQFWRAEDVMRLPRWKRSKICDSPHVVRESWDFGSVCFCCHAPHACFDLARTTCGESQNWHTGPRQKTEEIWSSSILTRGRCHAPPAVKKI